MEEGLGRLNRMDRDMMGLMWWLVVIDSILRDEGIQRRPVL
jgi:hypothetical protein